MRNIPDCTSLLDAIGAAGIVVVDAHARDGQLGEWPFACPRDCADATLEPRATHVLNADGDLSIVCACNVCGEVVVVRHACDERCDGCTACYQRTGETVCGRTCEHGWADAADAQQAGRG